MKRPRQWHKKKVKKKTLGTQLTLMNKQLRKINIRSLYLRKEQCEAHINILIYLWERNYIVSKNRAFLKGKKRDKIKYTKENVEKNKTETSRERMEHVWKLNEKKKRIEKENNDYETYYKEK